MAAVANKWNQPDSIHLAKMLLYEVTRTLLSRIWALSTLQGRKKLPQEVFCLFVVYLFKELF